jgi:MraZ protein
LTFALKFLTVSDVVETQATDVEISGDIAQSPAPDATLFRGRGEYAIDDKGRLTLPPHMRKPLADGGNLVVLDGRVVIWSEATYRRAVEVLNGQVDRHDLTQADVRNFLSNTHPVAPDTQGRIVVPHAARVEGSLDREVLVLGAGPRIEIVPAGGESLEGALGVSTAIADALDRAKF